MPSLEKLNSFMRARNANVIGPDDLGLLSVANDRELAPWEDRPETNCQWQTAVRLLLREECSVGETLLRAAPATDFQGQTLLHTAIAFQRVPAVISLLKRMVRGQDQEMGDLDARYKLLTTPDGSVDAVSGIYFEGGSVLLGP